MITKKMLKDKKIELSREQISKRAIEIAELMLESGSYKNAVSCIGRMVALSKAIDDGYWKEKFNRGALKEQYYLLFGFETNHPDRFTEVD